MKKVYLILIFLLAPIWGFSQKKVIDYLPVLFDTARVDVNYIRKRLYIKDTLLLDSFRVGFRVDLEFEYPLRDTSKPVNVKSVKLICLDIKSLTTKKQYRIDLFNEKGTRPQRKLWNRYSRLFNYWYRNQPYEKMIYRQIYGNKAHFRGVLYAIPR